MENGRWDAYTVDGTTFGRRIGRERKTRAETERNTERESKRVEIQFDERISANNRKTVISE